MKIFLTTVMLLINLNLSWGQVYQWNGQNNDLMGFSVSAAGDVNNDGFDDVIVGEPGLGISGRGGNAHVYSGANGILIHQWSSSGGFGHTVSAAGDVNNDGFDDVIIGEIDPYYSSNGTSHANVYSGSDGSLIYRFTSTNPGDLMGWSVSAAGDVNNDGFDDVIIGAPEWTSNGNGSVYLYSGANGSLINQWSGQSPGDLFGLSISGLEDINNDGIDDIVVGSPGSNNEIGAVYVYSGSNGSLIYQWNGSIGGEHFGHSVSKAGDVDNNGYPDVIIGSPHWNTGRACIYSGLDGSFISQLDGGNSDAEFGWSVSAAGDTNNNGCDDVIVGSPMTNGEGAVYVYSGSSGTLLYQWDGSPGMGGRNFGNSVAGAGDVNNDGVDDIIIGAPEESTYCGAAYVYLGVNSGVKYTIENFIAGHYALFHISEAPPNSLIRIGYSLAGAGPTNTPFGDVDMSPPIKSLVSLTADLSGDAWFTPLVPLGASGVTFYTQAKCGNMLSNSLALTVQ